MEDVIKWKSVKSKKVRINKAGKKIVSGINRK